MAILNIRIPDELDVRLKTLSKETGRTKTFYVRAALEEKLEELEDYYLGLESLEKVQTGKSKVWSHDEVKEDRDLED